MAKFQPPKNQRQEIAAPRRGEIFLCSFDPTVGREIEKTRPVLIVQNDVGNRYSPLTIVAAITSAISPVPYPIEIIVEPSVGNGLQVRSSVRLDQIRTIDRQRLIKRLGILDEAAMTKVNQAILISLGLVRI